MWAKGTPALRRLNRGGNPGLLQACWYLGQSVRLTLLRESGVVNGMVSGLCMRMSGLQRGFKGPRCYMDKMPGRPGRGGNALWAIAEMQGGSINNKGHGVQGRIHFDPDCTKISTGSVIGSDFPIYSLKAGRPHPL